MNSGESTRLSGRRRILAYIVKLLSAFLVGIVASLVGHVFIRYGSFGFVFVGVVFAGLFLKAFGKANVLKVLVFDAFFIFCLLLLDMYVNIGPKL